MSKVHKALLCETLICYVSVNMTIHTVLITAIMCYYIEEKVKTGGFEEWFNFKADGKRDYVNL